MHAQPLPATSPGGPLGRGALRLVRAASLTAVVLTVSVGAHVVAGGSAPSVLAMVPALVPVTAVTGLLTYVMASRRLPWWGPAVLMASAQLLVHQALSLPLPGVSASSSSMPMGSDPAGASGMPTMATLGGAVAQGLTHGGVAMVLAHALAALLLAGLLARADAALWGAVAAGSALAGRSFTGWASLLRPVHPVPSTKVPRPPQLGRRPRRHQPGRDQALTRRGPPASRRAVHSPPLGARSVVPLVSVA